VAAVDVAAVDVAVAEMVRASLTALSRHKSGYGFGAAPPGCITLTAVTSPNPRTASRPARRAATVLAGLVFSIALLGGGLSTPAAAATSSYEAADSLGLLPALLLFVGTPIGLFLLIWLLVVAGQLSRRPRRESDLSWFRDMTDDDATTPAELAAHTSGQDAEGVAPATGEEPELAAPAPADEPEPVTEPVTEPSGSTRVTPGS
jgi:hypothetical protein